MQKAAKARVVIQAVADITLVAKGHLTRAVITKTRKPMTTIKSVNKREFGCNEAISIHGIDISKIICKA